MSKEKESPKKEVKEQAVLSPDEASKQHVEIFAESQAQFRNLHKDMVSSIEARQAKNKELDEKLAEANHIKESAKALEKAAEAKNTQAEQLLESAKTKMEEAKEQESKILKIRAGHEKTDLALSKQRDEVMAREQAVVESEKSSQMKERELQFIRIKIERLIKDANIKEELKKEMLQELPKQKKG